MARRVVIFALWLALFFMSCRVSAFVLLLSRSDASASLAERAAEVARSASFLTPRGGVDRFELNGICLQDSLLKSDCDVLNQSSAGAGIKRLWETSGGTIEHVGEQSPGVEFNPSLWLLIHIITVTAVFASIGWIAGAIGVRSPVPAGLPTAWVRTLALAALMGTLVWSVVAPLRFFWAALWWKWGGAAWITMEYGALWGPAIAAGICYVVLLIWASRASLKGIGLRWPASGEDRKGHCTGCGYPRAGHAVCPECGRGGAAGIGAAHSRAMEWMMSRGRARLMIFWAGGMALAVCFLPAIFGTARAIYLLAESAIRSR